MDNIKVWVSKSLHGSETLWPALESALEGRVWHAVLTDEPTPIPMYSPWLYLESDFSYAPHRKICMEGGETRAVGTRFPMLLIFAPASEALQVVKAAEQLRTWLSTGHKRFESSRALLLVYGAPPASLASADVAVALQTSLIRHGLDIVELHGVKEAVEYVVQCVAAVAESRKRRVPSRFKVAGMRCKTLRDSGDKLRISWVSQLMQVPGVSEEIAKILNMGTISSRTMKYCFLEYLIFIIE